MFSSWVGHLGLPSASGHEGTWVVITPLPHAVDTRRFGSESPLSCAAAQDAPEWFYLGEGGLGRGGREKGGASIRNHYLSASTARIPGGVQVCGVKGMGPSEVSQTPALGFVLYPSFWVASLADDI